MTKEEIKKRLAIVDDMIKQHNEQMQQLVGNLNLLQGSRNECLFWLDKLGQGESVPVEDNKQDAA